MVNTDELEDALAVLGAATIIVVVMALVLGLVLLIYTALGGVLLYALVALGITSVAFSGVNSFLVGVVLLIISIVFGDYESNSSE